MIILEAPYASDVMLDWLESSQHPVLGNGFAKSLAKTRPALNLIDDVAAQARVEAGERVYTCSENALDWVLTHGGQTDLARCITLCKDKAATRRAMAAVDPSVFFREGTLTDLQSLDVSALTFPLVVKPSVGFISFGVHVVSQADAWLPTLELLEREISEGSVFPESVIGSGSFIVEGFITGQEYAIDLYFDGEGAPVILDVMQHDFRDAEDTSDHFYFTSADLMRKAVPPLTAWFAQVNQELRFRNFCTHVELRVTHAADQDPVDAMADLANIHVIEFNPLRFAGLCGTDMGYFAYNLRSYQWYLEDCRPDWAGEAAPEAVATLAVASSPDAARPAAQPAAPSPDAARPVAQPAAPSDTQPVFATCFIVLDTPSDWREGSTMDYRRFQADLHACGAVQVCDLRPMDPQVHGISCFPHFRVADAETFAAVRDFALNVRADDYLQQSY